MYLDNTPQPSYNRVYNMIGGSHMKTVGKHKDCGGDVVEIGNHLYCLKCDDQTTECELERGTVKEEE